MSKNKNLRDSDLFVQDNETQKIKNLGQGSYLNQVLDNSSKNSYNNSHYEQKYKSLGRQKQKNNTQCCHNEFENFNKTSNKLFQTSFSHHDPYVCVCEACTCGRHLCKFKTVKPDLTKSTVYKQSYDRKEPIPNVINRVNQYDKLNGPHLDMGSNYMKDFVNKKGEIERPKPEDLLKVGGPCQQLTSYSAGFPGYRGANQYVKPTDNIIRSNFPLSARTTYSNFFAPKYASKPKTQKIPDNLRARDLWMGKSTYGKSFQEPNPEDYPKRVKNNQKLNEDPNYNHQYETIYKNDFLGRHPAVCPAKIAIETKAKGFFNSSKQKFAQNTDFKSLNPAFHAISTSKHSYV